MVAASTNTKYLFMVTCEVIWIKYCIVNLLHGMWIALNFPINIFHVDCRIIT